MNRRKKYIFIVLVVLWTLFIWNNSLAPSDESSMQSGWILNLIDSIMGSLPFGDSTEFVVRKAAHMFEFFVLAILWCNLIPYYCEDGRWKLLIPFGLTVVTAMADETIQLHVPGRSGEVRDVCVDATGALIGIVLFLIILKLRKRKTADEG